MLDPKLEEAAAELAAIMKDIAGLRDTAEGDRAAAAKAVEGGQEGEGAEAEGGAGEQEMQARIESLQNRLREIVGHGGEEEGGEGQEGEAKEEEEEDSEAGDDDDEPPVLDTGGAVGNGCGGGIAGRPCVGAVCASAVSCMLSHGLQLRLHGGGGLRGLQLSARRSR